MTRRNHFRWSLDSNRDGHMTAAVVVGAAVSGIGLYLTQDWLAYAGLVTIGWEWMATPDVDYASKRKAKTLEWFIVSTFWLPFSWSVSHRSFLSHSILFGLPTRLAYVFVLGVMPLHYGLGIDGLIPGIVEHWQPILVGCAIADAVHLLKDNYHPVNLLFGK